MLSEQNVQHEMVDEAHDYAIQVEADPFAMIADSLNWSGLSQGLCVTVDQADMCFCNCSTKEKYGIYGKKQPIDIVKMPLNIVFSSSSGRLCPWPQWAVVPFLCQSLSTPGSICPPPPPPLLYFLCIRYPQWIYCSLEHVGMVRNLLDFRLME